MKRITRLLGVTLLEIMLVLAIAAMVLLMSMRYYQSATYAQQSNVVMQQLLAVVAAADSIAQGTGGYSAVTDSNVTAIVGKSNMTNQWGGTLAVTKAVAASYVVTLTKLPMPICASLAAKLAISKHFSDIKCDAGSLSYTYLFNIVDDV